jgi:putative acetyltransferase
MQIKSIQPHQIEEVKRLIITVCCEVFQMSEAEQRQYNDLSDLDRVYVRYCDRKGIFLVLLDEQKVVGCGGIRYFSEEICELKRMWFFKEYRGQGWGFQLTKLLFDFARNAGYQKVRLDLADEKKQSSALNFYRRLGFYFIERYNDSICTVFMERRL